MMSPKAAEIKFIWPLEHIKKVQGQVGRVSEERTSLIGSDIDNIDENQIIIESWLN